MATNKRSLVPESGPDRAPIVRSTHVLPFQLENLHELDGGKVAIAFQQLVARVAQDCMDRPGEQNPRKVGIEIIFKPVLEADGSCTNTKTQIQLSCSLPKMRTKVYDLATYPRGDFTFNRDCPDNHDQQPLEFGDE